MWNPSISQLIDLTFVFPSAVENIAYGPVLPDVFCGCRSLCLIRQHKSEVSDSGIIRRRFWCEPEKSAWGWRSLKLTGFRSPRITIKEGRMWEEYFSSHVARVPETVNAPRILIEASKLRRLLYVEGKGIKEWVILKRISSAGGKLLCSTLSRRVLLCRAIQ